MIEIFFAIILGLIAGVIVNILADDLPYRRKPGLPRYADGTPRPPKAWLGLTAFLFDVRQPGKKKRNNKQPDGARSRPHQANAALTWRYPLTEALIVFLMVLTVLATQNINQMSIAQLVIYWLYMAIFVLIIVIDIEHKLILFVVIIPSILLALFDAALLPQPEPDFVDAIIGGLFGFGFFMVIYLGGYLFTFLMNRLRAAQIETVAFGYGDVMMITFSGAVLGIGFTFLAIFITMILGSMGAFVYLFGKRLLSGQYEAFAAIPYGPYIVVATIIMRLYGDVMWRIIVG